MKLRTILFSSLLFTAPIASAQTAPSIDFATYLGGTTFDQLRDVAIDTQGNIYVTGGTDSANFPTTAGAYQRTVGQGQNPDNPATTGRVDVFVAKFTPSGSLVWSTLLGGPNYDRAYAIKVDNAGFIYVAGRAGRGFPTTPNSFGPVFQGSPDVGPYGPEDGFIAKLTPDGQQLVWGSFFGTTDELIVRDIDIDVVTGDIYLASAWASGTFPPAVASKFNNSPKGGHDAVFAKIKSDGTQVLWATYAGGSAFEDHQGSIRTDSRGNVVGLFTTQSAGIASPGAFDTTYGGNSDLFIEKFSPTTGAMIWGGYVGGSGGESTETHELPGIDASGNVYVAGPTSSPTDFPTTPGAFQRTFGGGVNDMFVMKISADGRTMLASTYLGGNSNDRPEGTFVDPSGRVYLTGVTRSDNYPTTANAYRRTYSGFADGVAIVLAPDLSSVVYGTYFAGSQEDFGRGGRADNNGNFYFGGETTSPDLPVRNAYSTTYFPGSGDAFIAKLHIPLVTVSPCDSNSDGTTNALDVQLSINQALAFTPCVTDVNVDGTCNVIDLQRIANAALTGTCVSP